MDSRGRIFVADRGNSRIQIFDRDGRFLDQWKQFGRPSGVFIDKNDTMYVVDSQSNSKQNPGFTRGIPVGSARDGKVNTALKIITESRGLEVPETAEQRQWLRDFASWLVSTQAVHQAAAAGERRGRRSVGQKRS
jgi:hypothetical protein